jgi:Putative MetA-pathway of phenol degradation
MRLVSVATALLALAAQAEGIDRDSLLSEAPAVPAKGTVRVSGVTTGTSDEGGVNNTQGQANVSGTIMWTPVENLAGDVGMYWQVGANGPSARVRYQLLSQFRSGFDLSAGARFKTVGFNPDQGEVEFLLLAGRRFGRFELVLNGVFGFETGGKSGKDVEGKAFAGYRFSEDLRAGVDGRLQAEVGDEEAAPVGAPPKTGRDYDFTAGPAVSWIAARNLGTLFRNLQVQGLLGVAQPKRTDTTAAVGIVSASIDF